MRHCLHRQRGDHEPPARGLAINELKGRNGSAAPPVPWFEKAGRAAAGAKRELSRVRHDPATLLPDESESAPYQKRIKIAKVAEIRGRSVRTVYRWIRTDAALALTIIPSDSLWFGSSQRLATGLGSPSMISTDSGATRRWSLAASRPLRPNA